MFFKRFLLLTLTLLSIDTFADAPRTYNIQMIVFSHLTPQSLSAEQWPILPIPSTINAPTPARSANALQGEANNLRKNPEYQVLWSGSWTQTWQQGNGTVTLPLSNGNNLQGNITVTLGHYFDIHTDLMMIQPTSYLQKIAKNSYFNNISQSSFGFQLTQDRRMKSGELNYLGNPVVGVLIKILK